MLDDKSYNNKLDRYLYKYPDTSESDYLKAQIYNCRKLIDSIESRSEYSLQEEAINKVGNESYEKVMQQIEIVKANDIGHIARVKKEVVWYQTRLARTNPINQANSIDNELSLKPTRLTWIGQNIELVELLKALCESKKFQEPYDKTVFEQFCKFLGVENLKQTETLKTIRKRTDKKTPFIDNLSASMTSWINAKDN